MASDKCMVLMLEHAVKLTDINPSRPGIYFKGKLRELCFFLTIALSFVIFANLLVIAPVIFPCCTACVLSVGSASPSDMGNEGFGLFCMLRLIFISIGYKQCGTSFAFMFFTIHRKASG
ncbi:hypothetical protein EI94DRAFT_1708746 [Lactarius quietus]|nr:hypothetical protein EI94DRAFT_1708746 [Lactarius quietus]